jgi:hypothetical protein
MPSRIRTKGYSPSDCSRADRLQGCSLQIDGILTVCSTAVTGRTPARRLRRSQAHMRGIIKWAHERRVSSVKLCGKRSSSSEDRLQQTVISERNMTSASPELTKAKLYKAISSTTAMIIQDRIPYFLWLQYMVRNERISRLRIPTGRLQDCFCFFQEVSLKNRKGSRNLKVKMSYMPCARRTSHNQSYALTEPVHKGTPQRT